MEAPKTPPQQAPQQPVKPSAPQPLKAGPTTKAYEPSGLVIQEVMLQTGKTFDEAKAFLKNPPPHPVR